MNDDEPGSAGAPAGMQRCTPAGAPALPGRLLAIDYGRVRVGIATCDELGIACMPLGFIKRESDAQVAGVIAQLAKREKAVALLIGLPLHANGEKGANVAWVHAFLRELAKVCALTVHQIDERYSSSEAEEELRAMGRWPAPKGQVDAQSAVILLRRFLAGER